MVVEFRNASTSISDLNKCANSLGNFNCGKVQVHYFLTAHSSEDQQEEKLMLLKNLTMFVLKGLSLI